MKQVNLLILGKDQ